MAETWGNTLIKPYEYGLNEILRLDKTGLDSSDPIIAAVILRFPSGLVDGIAGLSRPVVEILTILNELI